MDIVGTCLGRNVEPDGAEAALSKMLSDFYLAYRQDPHFHGTICHSIPDTWHRRFATGRFGSGMSMRSRTILVGWRAVTGSPHLCSLQPTSLARG